MDSGIHHGVCFDVTSLGSDMEDDIYAASLLRDPFHSDFCEFEVVCSQSNLSACTESFDGDYGFAYVYKPSKLTKKHVVDIFQLRLAKKPTTAGTLAKKYGVTAKAIRDIWTGKTWRPLTFDVGLSNLAAKLVYVQ